MNDHNRLPLATMLFSLIVFYLIELMDSVCFIRIYLILIHVKNLYFRSNVLQPLNMSTTSGNGIFRLYEKPKNL